MLKLGHSCIAIVCTLIFLNTANAATGPLEIEKLIIMPDHKGHSDWISAIQNARRSIHLSMYHLTDVQVIDALAQKAQQMGPDFDLRILVDGESFRGGYQKAVQPLTSLGVQLRPSSPAFSITHEKAMVIDGSLAFITAINLTKTYDNTRDFGIITADAGVIREMTSVFEVDWVNAQNGTGNTPELAEKNLLWSPINSASKLIDFIDSAQGTLLMQVESLSDQDMINAFTRASQRGVNVEVIVPKCVSGNSLFDYPALEKLESGGVHTHVMPNPSSFTQPYIHSKMMVADQESIYIGSVNFSVNSLHHARELGVVFDDAPIADQMSRIFAEDWQASEEPVPNPSTAICQRAG